MTNPSLPFPRISTKTEQLQFDIYQQVIAIDEGTIGGKQALLRAVEALRSLGATPFGGLAGPDDLGFWFSIDQVNRILNLADSGRFRKFIRTAVDSPGRVNAEGLKNLFHTDEATHKRFVNIKAIIAATLARTTSGAQATRKTDKVNDNGEPVYTQSAEDLKRWKLLRRLFSEATQVPYLEQGKGLVAPREINRAVRNPPPLAEAHSVAVETNFSLMEIAAFLPAKSDFNINVKYNPAGVSLTLAAQGDTTTATGVTFPKALAELFLALMDFLPQEDGLYHYDDTIAAVEGTRYTILYGSKATKTSLPLLTMSDPKAWGERIGDLPQ